MSSKLRANEQADTTVVDHKEHGKMLGVRGTLLLITLILITRWNPALYAEQGYFVVAVNPTGSTGYGQEFTDAIQNEWGGREYFSHPFRLHTHPQDPSRTFWRDIMPSLLLSQK